jgi:hypothetical protein
MSLRLGLGRGRAGWGSPLKDDLRGARCFAQVGSSDVLGQ